MSKNKYTQEQKLQACQDYEMGRKSAKKIALELGMSVYGAATVRLWHRQYQVNGAEALCEWAGNKTYSKEFKTKVVDEFLSGKISLTAVTIKYNISDKILVKGWVKKYNSHIELRDYDPKTEVYMADTKKTTYEERVEIVGYCLENGRDIKGTASKYGCNYTQVYQWVRKFEEKGEDGLIDKRGKRKQEDELTALEKAEKKIAQLEREKEEFRKRYELLKKAEERERWR